MTDPKEIYLSDLLMGDQLEAFEAWFYDGRSDGDEEEIPDEEE